MSIKTRILTATAALSLLAAGAIGVAAQASAQEPTPAAGAAHQQGQRRDAFLSRVATNLGITVEQLKQAFKDAALQAVDDALANGKIDETQAAKMKERINNGNALGLRQLLKERRQVRQRQLIRREIGQSAASAIGITFDDLKAEIMAGKSIAGVAAEHNVSLDTVKTAILADAKSKLDQAVANGRIKQQRADKALQTLTDNIDKILNRTKGDAPAAAAR
jgi:hypothetical protein